MDEKFVCHINGFRLKDTEARRMATTAGKMADEAMEKATVAEKKIEEAVTTANRAKTTADGAVVTAKSAYTTAALAESKAKSAEDTATAALPRKGGTMLGDIDMGRNNINNATQIIGNRLGGNLLDLQHKPANAPASMLRQYPAAQNVLKVESIPWNGEKFDDTAAENVVIRGVAPGVKENDAVNLSQVREMVMNGTGSDSGQNVELDTTMTQSGKAADAKAVGDALANVGKPTDEQVNEAVNDYLDANPVDCSCVFNATEVITSNQFWFTGKDSTAWGNIGQVMDCKAGERFFWNGKLNTSGGSKTPVMLSALPNGDSIYDTSVTVGAELPADADGGYTATADGAVFFPALWSNGSQSEGYINNGYTYLGAGNWFVFKGGVIDDYYVNNFPVNHIFNVNPSLLDLAGLLKNYIPMVGAKVAVLGDSLSEQSAGHGNAGKDSYGFSQGRYNEEGWFARIARKYNMDYRVHGVGMQWWYCTSARPNGGVKAVNSLIESGYNPDYIVLEYGTNDIWTGGLGEVTDTADAAATSTVGAMRYCIETLQAELPSARIIVIMPCMRIAGGSKQDSYYEMAAKILREYGVRYVDMLGDSGIVKSMMNADGIHLATFDTDHYNQHTEAVARYSRCLESAMLNL